MTMNHAAAIGAPSGTSFRGVSVSPTSAPQEEPLADLYCRHFTLQGAKTEQQKRQVYNLRYRVLAEENGYLNPAEYPDAMEQDEYDHRAEHYLLRHNLTGDIAGTVRVILPDAEAAGNELQFVHHCAVSDVYNRVPIMQSAEVSRFAVSRAFRRRMTDGVLPDVYDPTMGHVPVDEMRRLVPYITIGLIRGMVEGAVEHRMTHLVTVMEPTLVRLLQRFGIYFDKVGPLIPLFGWRQPCARSLTDLMRGVETERPDVWEIVSDRGRLWEELQAYDK